jgi:hypothetical protein
MFVLPVALIAMVSRVTCQILSHLAATRQIIDPLACGCPRDGIVYGNYIYMQERVQGVKFVKWKYA